MTENVFYSPKPDPIKNNYKLTDDAINALEALVERRMNAYIESPTFSDRIHKKYTAQLDKYMMDQYPDLSNRLNSLSLVLDDQTKQIQKSLDAMKKREKILVKSESVYEDVYKLRDEFKEIKKFVDEFQKKMKKVFEL